MNPILILSWITASLHHKDCMFESSSMIHRVSFESYLCFRQIQNSAVSHIITLSLNKNDEVFTNIDGTTCSSTGARNQLYFQGKLIYPYWTTFNDIVKFCIWYKKALYPKFNHSCTLPSWWESISVWLARLIAKIQNKKSKWQSWSKYLFFR